MALAVLMHVLAFEQAGDAGLADRERAQDQGAVRDRLVAGHAHAALERAGAARGQRSGCGLRVHGDFWDIGRRPSTADGRHHAAAASGQSGPASALLTAALQLAK